MNNKYILKGHIPILEPDLLTWAKWFETADRKVANDIFDNVRVSTVFLGLDHSFLSGKPLLFETMVFGGDFDGEQKKYSTWEEAEKGHKKMLKKIFFERSRPYERIETVPILRNRSNK